MDREEALKLLRGGRDGINSWNRWRLANDILPSLEGANLSGADVSAADLSWANLHEANLVGTRLRAANLREAILSKAHLHTADLSGAKLASANLQDADLTSAELFGADLTSALLDRANLAHAYVVRVDLRAATMTDADFTDGRVCDCDLYRAVLVRARLCGTNLAGSRLAQCRVDDADFTDAIFRAVSIECDMSSAIGLDRIRHLSPSRITVDSVLCFRKELPEAFLRGCGLSEEEIAHFRSRAGGVVQFYSCFISYSTDDEDFAARLHNDFQAAGIRCWKWDHDARTGRTLWGEIDQAIRVHDKLVLIASKASLESPAVNREIERAICQEDAREKQKQAGQRTGSTDVLFPVRLDDFIFDGWVHERKVDVTKKVVADARGWDTDPAVYARVRDKLIKDLKPD